MPGVVRPWAECQPNFADDLRQHVQSNGGIFPLCKRQRRPLVRRVIHVVFLPAVNEIGKRALDPVKHVSRFFLCPVKRILDAPFDTSERAAFLVTVIIVLHIFHGRAGKHSFCLLHRAAHRSDMNRADWAR